MRIRRKYRVVAPELDERRRRQWAAAEAREAGYGGVSVVAQATGLARSTIHAGLRDLRASPRQREIAAQRIRRAGGGRWLLTTTDPALLTALLALIEPTTRGDPESPLRWTCKSTAQLAEELTRRRHQVSPRTVATLLKDAGYSLQANRKTREGTAHPDRDAQFHYLVISDPVDLAVCAHFRFNDSRDVPRAVAHMQQNDPGLTVDVAQCQPPRHPHA
jgi:Rhodopirellula transposase DDE domain